MQNVNISRALPRLPGSYSGINQRTITSPYHPILTVETGSSSRRKAADAKRRKYSISSLFGMTYDASANHNKIFRIPACAGMAAGITSSLCGTFIRGYLSCQPGDHRGLPSVLFRSPVGACTGSVQSVCVKNQKLSFSRFPSLRPASGR